MSTPGSLTAVDPYWCPLLCSVLLRYLDPLLRKTAGVGAWQVVSQAVAEGTVVVMDGLEGIQGKHFDEPQVTGWAVAMWNAPGSPAAPTPPGPCFEGHG